MKWTLALNPNNVVHTHAEFFLKHSLFGFRELQNKYLRWNLPYISLQSLHFLDTYYIRAVKYTTRSQQYMQTTLFSQLHTLQKAIKRLVWSDFSFGVIDVIQVAVRNQLWEDLMEVEAVLYQKHCKHSSRCLPWCWSTRMNRSGNGIEMAWIIGCRKASMSCLLLMKVKDFL